MSNNNLRKDFKIFENNPGLVYLDSTATTQKPGYVTSSVKEYLENDYGNIHRGFHPLAERSEKLYIDSKKKVAEFIGAWSWREVIYTLNSTYASNLLIASLRRSGYFQKWDKVLLSIVEHHANIVPWLILKEEIGIEVEYVSVKDDFSLDLEDLEKKLDDTVKAVSLTHVSNVTGSIFDLEEVGKALTPNPSPNGRGGHKPLFIVDASQSVPHFKVDVEKIGCDFMFFTGHKLMADSGIGVLWWKESILNELQPAFSGGGAISRVEEQAFTLSSLPDKFEPGTPNLSGAMSLLKAFEYIENIWGYEKIVEVEEELTEYALKRFNSIENLQLIGSKVLKNRVGVFSFVVEWIHSHDIADYMADSNICIRAGQHCAEPLMNYLKINNTCRMSLYIYNDTKDIDDFFSVLEKCILELK